MLDGFRGIVSFTVYTDSPEDFLNHLRNSTVSARNIKAETGKLSGEIYWFDLKSLKKIADKYKAEFEETDRHGFIFTAVRYRKRVGFIIGIVAAVVMIFLLSNITMKINIYGNETMSDAEVLAVLSDCGIHIGSYLPNVNLRGAERDIITNVKGVAWAGIRRSGPIVYVEISEMTGKPAMVPTNSPCNIISSKDAQIVKINSVPMGMLKPMLGDTVKKGQILVSGVFEGKLHNTFFVHAMADITGRYEEKLRFTQNLTDYKLEYGDRQTKRSLYLFGLRVPLYVGKLDETDAEVNEDINYFELFSLKLPIGVVNTEIRPYSSVEQNYTPDEAIALLKEKVSRYERNFYDDEGVTIVDKAENFSAKDGAVSVTVNYVLESNICEEQTIMVKNHK